jgi:hypothetical protein
MGEVFWALDIERLLLNISIIGINLFISPKMANQGLADDCGIQSIVPSTGKWAIHPHNITREDT